MSSESFDWDGGPADYEPPPFSQSSAAGEIDDAPSARRRKAQLEAGQVLSNCGASEAASGSGWTPPMWNPPTDTAPIWSPSVWPPPTGSLPVGEPISISQEGASRRGVIRRVRAHLLHSE